MMSRLIRAELFKLRTTNLWWLFTLATLISTVVTLVINCFTAHSLFKPLSQYISLHRHGHGTANMPPEFLARLTEEWTTGHNAVTQASTIYTSGQLIGVLLACLLGIVLVTSEFYQQTATTTFLLTPHRTAVVISKLITGVLVAAAAWLVSTAVTVIAGAAFLHAEGYGSQLGHWDVVRALLLNLIAYLIWAVFGIGIGALIRSQLAATVTATVLYLAGAAAAGAVFDLLNTYVIKQTWILTAQVIVPAVASTVMTSPVKTFTESPPQWVGAAVLIGYGVLAGAFGIWTLRRRDIA
jgi:ABC-2 type transport system permease protein